MCLILITFEACSEKVEEHPFAFFSLEQYDTLRQRELSIDDDSIRYYIDRLRLAERDTTLIDAYTNRYYAQRNPYLWITRFGVVETSDSLLLYLSAITNEGIPYKRVYFKQLQESVDKIRNNKYQQDGEKTRTLATIEYYATKAYLRYVCGMKFGFINPYKLFNHLDPEDPDDSIPGHFRTLYDVPTKLPTHQLLDSLIQGLRENHCHEFLQKAICESPEYQELKKRYKQAESKFERKLLAVNMERMRWNVPHPEGKRVEANLANFSLTAIDPTSDSCITMKTCIGSRTHKTPLLYSHISYLEINPIWTVPQSIIRREIAPRHAGDVEYFEHNRMTIIDRETGEEACPLTTSAEMLQSGKYIIQQAQGESNSLGRLIFRFPNNFSIYLHDTPNKDVFNQKWRGLSHGCVRLEHPFNLAVFLLEGKDPELIDRIRVAINLQPETDEEKALFEDPNRKDIKHYTYKPRIPILITYKTVSFDPKGEPHFISTDPYGYDELLWKQINR